MLEVEQTLVLALLGGILPALIWLWLWLEEDERAPEPKWLLSLAFVAGAMAVLPSLIFERLTLPLLSGGALITSWAAIEEILKYAFVAAFVLWRREVDEPVDVVIYLITGALGFAAFENTLFLINSLTHASLIESVLTGNFRFIGATLLHTLSSAAIGLTLALTFYKKRVIRLTFLALGGAVAIALHALFNFFIMKGSGGTIPAVFLAVWIGTGFLILAFEKIKRLRKPSAFSTLTK